MDDEKYFASNWSRKDIIIKDKQNESEILKMVIDTIWNLRRILIKLKIDSLMEELKQGKTLNEVDFITDYNDLKVKISYKLNRVV